MKAHPHIRMGVAQLICIGIILAIGGVNSSPFAKKSDSSGLVKRPFCNAFTGCGRKRSDPSFKNLPIDDEQDDDMTDDWNQFDSNYPGAYRTQDGQRRYGFFPG